MRCFVRDAPPAFRALLRGLRQMLLRSARDHRRDRRNAEFGGFFDRPLHAIELVDGHHQSNGQRGVGLELGGEVEANFARFSGQGDRGHLGMKDAAARHNVGFHARLRAQHARQMFGLRTNDGCGCFVPMFGDPAAARHRAVISSSKVYGVVRTRSNRDFVECANRRSQSGF